ncbi:hypothetical protein FQR65_LT06350 [Abscondita terminalis]|nr:hypothetical protein FQR65_LT06350 [Abscondita terminalis]
MPSGSQEEIELSTNTDDANGINNNKSAFYERKRQSKPIRVLTVLAYVLSVSLAAIILSAYYVFMWEGKPSLAYHSCAPADLENETENKINDNHSKIIPDKPRTKFTDELLRNAMKNSTKNKNRTQEQALMLSSEMKSTVIRNTDESSNEISQVTMNVEETMYLTTPTEENSTWLPEIENDFEGDYNDFKTEPIFIKKLFGYRKVKVK